MTTYGMMEAQGSRTEKTRTETMQRSVGIFKTGSDWEGTPLRYSVHQWPKLFYANGSFYSETFGEIHQEQGFWEVRFLCGKDLINPSLSVVFVSNCPLSATERIRVHLFYLLVMI